MKNITMRSLLLMILFFMTSMVMMPNICFAKNGSGFWASIFGGTSISGNGNVVTKTVSFADQYFNSIELRGSGEMKVNVTHKHKTGEATIITDSNLLPHIEMYVKNKTLYIGNKDNVSCRSWTKKEFLIIADDLQSININGSGNVHVNEINADDFYIKINGSGNAKVNGEVKNLSIKVNGSGKIDASGLNANTVDASILGSGEIVASVLKKINIGINGFGSVKYFGKPAVVKQSITGLGRVTAL